MKVSLTGDVAFYTRTVSTVSNICSAWSQIIQTTPDWGRLMFSARQRECFSRFRARYSDVRHKFTVWVVSDDHDDAEHIEQRWAAINSQPLTLWKTEKVREIRAEATVEGWRTTRPDADVRVALVYFTFIIHMHGAVWLLLMSELSKYIYVCCTIDKKLAYFHMSFWSRFLCHSPT